MADFTPAAVARQVPATAKLLEAREQLANLLRYMDGKVAAEDQLKKLLSDPAVDGRAQGAGRSTQQPTATQAEQVRQGPRSWQNKLSATKLPTQTETVAADEFSALLKQSFKPRTERAATEVENAVSTLVREALKDTHASSRTTSSTRSRR